MCATYSQDLCHSLSSELCVLFISKILYWVVWSCRAFLSSYLYWCHKQSIYVFKGYTSLADHTSVTALRLDEEARHRLVLNEWFMTCFSPSSSINHWSVWLLKDPDLSTSDSSRIIHVWIYLFWVVLPDWSCKQPVKMWLKCPGNLQTYTFTEGHYYTSLFIGISIFKIIIIRTTTFNLPMTQHPKIVFQRIQTKSETASPWAQDS